MRFRAVLLLTLLLAGCAVNSDPVENAPEEVIGEECHLDSEHHQHEPGHICSETTWFFTQPWAARWFWGKLLRDGFVFMALAGVIFGLTALRRRM
jgi:hypothetical protein